MNKEIKLEQLSEYRPHLFTAEASSLGLRAGQWPTSIEVKGLGNGFKFYPTKMDDSGVRYKQELGCVLIQVFND